MFSSFLRALIPQEISWLFIIKETVYYSMVHRIEHFRYVVLFLLSW